MSRSPQKPPLLNMQLAWPQVAQSQPGNHLNGDHGRRLRSAHRDVRRPSSVFRLRVTLDSRQSQAFRHNARRCSLLAASQCGDPLQASRNPLSPAQSAQNQKRSPTARPQSVTARHKVLTRHWRRGLSKCVAQWGLDEWKRHKNNNLFSNGRTARQVQFSRLLFFSSPPPVTHT